MICNCRVGRSCNGNGIASGVGGQVADGIALLFATLDRSLSENGVASGAVGGVGNGVLNEV